MFWIVEAVVTGLVSCEEKGGLDGPGLFGFGGFWREADGNGPVSLVEGPN